MRLIEFTFVALWLVWITYWTASAWGNKRTTEQLNPLWRILALVLAFTVYWAIRYDPEYFNRRLLEPSAARSLFGLALTASGVFLSIWARRILGTNWSANPMIKEGHELIQSGPYCWVRHPIYTGILLGILGTNVADARIRDVYIFALAAFMLLVKLKIEERFMLKQFPTLYPEYRKRTKALVPFVF